MSNAFEYSRGETIKVALDIEDNDASVVFSSVVAQLKPAQRGARIVAENVAPVASFQTLPSDTGWVFVLDSDVSATLAAGRYVMDAKLTLDNDEVIYTDPLAINIIPGVTS